LGKFAVILVTSLALVLDFRGIRQYILLYA